MDDSFSAIDQTSWSHEIQTGGYGWVTSFLLLSQVLQFTTISSTGSFDWTTDDSSNSYVNSEGLHIRPTLTNSTTDITNAQIDDGYTLNLTVTGDCTTSDVSNCGVRSNRTTGAIIPPVRSARLTTKGKKTIRYGKVEVTAKLPKGDWMWPAIWFVDIPLSEA